MHCSAYNVYEKCVPVSLSLRQVETMLEVELNFTFELRET